MLALAGLLVAGAAEAKVKNVIIMIGDGCGFNQLATGEFYRYGRADAAVYRQFPVKLAASTFSVKGSYDPARAWDGLSYIVLGATDSAAAATALATGHKTYNGAIGVDRDGKPLQNLCERAKELGKAAGVVTSVPLSHATPAGFVAHNKGRGSYAEIGREMIERSRCDVIMGAGHPTFDNGGKQRAPKYDYVGGPETWGAVKTGRPMADADGDGRPDAWKLVETKADFAKLAATAQPLDHRVLGVAQAGDTLQCSRPKKGGKLPFEDPRNADVPSLAQMTQGALNVLGLDRDGFFVMVEGGAIDWASHGNDGVRVVEEVMDFEDAIAAAAAWVEKYSSWDETLLIVTADHETGLLTGPAAASAFDGPVGQGQDKLPLLAFHSKGHSNSLVPVFAKGAEAQRLTLRAVGKDPKRGAYLDNTDLPKTVLDVWAQ